MPTLSHHAARAHFHMVNNVMEVSYSGPLTPGALLNIRMGLLANMADSTCMMLHYEKSLLLMDRMPVHRHTDYKYQSAAIIIRPDQRALFNVYSEELAEIGVLRMLFLESQQALALEWLALQADRRSRLGGQHPVSPSVALSH